MRFLNFKFFCELFGCGFDIFVNVFRFGVLILLWGFFVIWMVVNDFVNGGSLLFGGDVLGWEMLF